MNTIEEYQLANKTKNDLNGSGLKEKIKNFWNDKPCGTLGVVPNQIDLIYFERIKERRYKLEPCIREVVDFSKLNRKRVLEVGCGIGIDSLEFAKVGAAHIGIDISTRSVALARKYFELNGYSPNISLADAGDLPFSDDSFDFIYSWGVLHHTTHMKKSLAEIYRVLKHGGDFCIMLYNRRSLVGLQLYLVYGLLRLKPFVSWKKLFAEHHESPGTEAFTDRETLILFKKFSNVKIANIVTSYDVRLTRNRFLPRSLQGLVPSKFGFFKVITGKKQLIG